MSQLIPLAVPAVVEAPVGGKISGGGSQSGGSE
jgi:hypothetical protein